MNHPLKPNVAVLLAFSFLLISTVGYANPPVNTTNYSQTIQGGEYFNTVGHKTTFTNRQETGLWLHSGSNLRGSEVDANGNLTNNGGTFLFYAPKQVVRLDGQVDVRGVLNGNGAFAGNGGKVLVDSAYLFQGGNIYASGINGGHVQFNVGGATIANGAHIEAQGYGGHGGTITLQAIDPNTLKNGSVSIGKDVVLNTSGAVNSAMTTNAINILAGVVNVEGRIQANGVETQGGMIRLRSLGQTDLSASQTAINTGGVFTNTEANTILVGLNTLKQQHDGDVVIVGGATPAMIVANGANGGVIAKPNEPPVPNDHAKLGGSVYVRAKHDINNAGWLLTNGGNGTPSNFDLRHGGFLGDGVTNGGDGGSIHLTAENSITNSGRMVSDGGAAGIYDFGSYGFNGGNGGSITLTHGSQMVNSGVIRANGANATGAVDTDLPDIGGSGGNGGQVVFKGPGNPPQGTGMVTTLGGHPTYEGSPTDPYNPTFDGSYGRLGTITALNPKASTNTLLGIWQKSP